MNSRYGLRICFAALALMGTLIEGSLTPTSTQVVVPSEAIELANDILKQTWIPAASRNPEFYDLAGLDPSRARIGEPFCELELRGLNIDEFLAADENDPSKFAGVEKYCFPLFVDDEGAGAIVVSRNRDENGAKFSVDYGDFMFFGYYGRRNTLVQQVQRLKSRFADSEIAWVWFVGTHIPPQVLVRLIDGQLMSGRSESDLRPAAVAASAIRDEIRTARQRQSDMIREE